jgi:hypothetical protein
MTHLLIVPARGTGEPGNLGMVVGDPVHARLVRDLGVFTRVQGYPVQVRFTKVLVVLKTNTHVGDSTLPSSLADSHSQQKEILIS